jgi:hypothetical protein
MKHIETELLLIATNNSWLYAVHASTRSLFACMLADYIRKAQRDLNDEYDINADTFPELSTKTKKEVMTAIIEHYTEEIIETAIKVLER